MFIFNITDLLELLVVFIIILLFLFAHLILHIREKLIDRKYTKQLDKNKQKAVKIIDEFESLLFEHNIKIPNLERNNNDNETCIYGTDYYDLEDSIIEILNERS